MSPATRLLLGGFLTLVLVMGIGRFYYTPLLPLMQREAGFGPALAGLIGSANFAGYLLGSIGAFFVPRGRARLWVFRAAVVTSAATTLAMGFSDNLAFWLTVRTVAGVASAYAMLLAAAIVAEALAAIDEPGRMGWVFGGVGMGIALSGLFVLLARDALDAAGLWFAAGIFSLLMLPVILAEVGERRLPVRPERPPDTRRLPRPLPFPPLFASYFCEGLGFSVFAVFIVAIVKLRPGLENFGDWVWIMVGLAGFPSALFWAWSAERIGYAKALLIAYLTQAVGVVLPALSSGPAATIAAAILFGGTFLGITVLTQPLGRHGFGGRGFAVLTVGFGVGQVAGPVLAGLFVTEPADYRIALLASSAILLAGASFLLRAILTREPDPL